jgi:hypothetical protein
MVDAGGKPRRSDKLGNNPSDQSKSMGMRIKIPSERPVEGPVSL